MFLKMSYKTSLSTIKEPYYYSACADNCVNIGVIPIQHRHYKQLLPWAEFFCHLQSNHRQEKAEE
jgi:hypothetical protein